MKILSGTQIREADAYTIANEPVSSIDLMERAAEAFVCRFLFSYLPDKPLYVFCGPGNNGGDGLAISRMLIEKEFEVHTYVLDLGKGFSKDFEENHRRLKEMKVSRLSTISGADQIPSLPGEVIIIDALFGTGLSRPVEGFAAEVIKTINTRKEIVAVDLPSGLFTDTQNSETDTIIRAKRTFTFQMPKLSFFFCSSEKYTGDWEELDIKLSREFIDRAETSHYYIDQKLAKNILKPRHRCDHKGTYGHALTWTGAYGKMGAAQLCAKACLNTGAGLTTAYIPACGYTIFQTALPEIMVLTDPENALLTTVPDLEKYNAIGIGPGIGKDPKTATALKGLLEAAKDIPTVIDADALNIISENKALLNMLPKNAILTPHPKEFERLAGKAKDDWHRQELASAFATEHKCVLVLKGAYTSVNLPDGTVYFNATGNPGMAKGGTGDAVTGIITGLLAQKYTPAEAAILGVYLHGQAGDLAANNKGQWSMTASDLIDCLGGAYFIIDI
jgi:ADP-dependent NAD(P)H-hydrate dehydratase / NAD(P)H-hydrate epimerase